MKETISIKSTADEFPVLALRGMCIFPKTEMAFDIAREKSISAISRAVSGGQKIFLVAQKNAVLEEPTPDDLFETGTVCRVKEYVTFPNGRVRIVVNGIYRAQIAEITGISPHFTAKIKKTAEKGKKYGTSLNFQADKRILLDLIGEYKSRLHGEDDLTAARLTMIEDPEVFSFEASNLIEINYMLKQQLLEETDLKKRIDLLTGMLKYELGIVTLMSDVNRRVQENFGKQQKEAFIREEIKILKEELGEDDESELAEYKRRLDAGDFPEAVRSKLEKDILRLERMSPAMADSQVLRNYLDFVFDLPWTVHTDDSVDIKRAEAILERDHYGLKDVKQRILEYLAVRTLKKGGRDPILCLFGPPGVGKTSIAKSIAEAMHKKYVRMSLGGVHDEAEIRGHRKTYVGAMPGRIISAIKQAGTNNPLLLLDEIDKLGKDMRGDPGAALLEVLDGEQNFSFRDHYVELPFDLSGVTFITTANSLDSIPGPLRDRMEIIEINGYSQEEKLMIAKRHLLPKQLREHGLEKSAIRISDAVLNKVIWEYTAESGVRELERTLGTIIRKTVLKMSREKKRSCTVTLRDLPELLGPAKRYDEIVKKEDKVGVAGGLAWTSVGGVSLSVEVNVFPGSGHTELTGSLGDVMKESAKAALSYIRSRADNLGLETTFYKKSDIHIHVPAGATPKDGPSAGITMATALVSALTGRPVRHDVAMTGEITLRGEVLPVGGLKEKSLAAMRRGVSTLILPEANKRDERDLPESVKQKLHIVYAKTMEDVLGVALR